jgi:uncharacterized protein YcbK (DUF882 family)
MKAPALMDGDGESPGGQGDDVNAARRRLLQLAGAGLACVAAPAIWLPGTAGAANGVAVDLWPRANDVRQIWIRRPVTGEEGVLRYHDGAQMQSLAYSRICSIMRDVRGNEVMEIDIALLDLMFVMQKWLVSWGIDRPLVINSGYRNRHTNSITEGAKKNSMHTSGRAADITMPGIPADYLGRLAAIFKKGGVGFYPGNGFVHIDTGSVRYWGARQAPGDAG